MEFLNLSNFLATFPFLWIGSLTLSMATRVSVRPRFRILVSPSNLQGFIILRAESS